MEWLTKYESIAGHAHAVPLGTDDDVVNRLAAYEDTGLTPEEIMQMKETQLSGMDMFRVYAALDMLEKYQTAEKEGRLVVLPCKVGDKSREEAEKALEAIKEGANVVPVSELLELRDALYDNDQIALQGYWKLNALIAKHTTRTEDVPVEAIGHE